MIWLSSALAATLVVDPASGPYASISAALEVAQDGDLLELSGDTFTECVDAGLSLTIAGSSGTVVDASGLCDNAFVVNDGETLTLTDLEVVNAGGRGLYQYWSNTTLERVTVRDSGASTVYGPAVYTYGGDLLTTDCSFLDNNGDQGGAFYLYAYGTWTDSNSVFEGNSATSGGGGVYSYYDNDVTLHGTVFDTNSSGGQAGGMWQGWYGALSVDEARFSSNTALGSGGGLMIYAVDDVVPITNTLFEDNESTEGHGGAIEMEWYADLQIAGSSFTDNRAPLNSGGAVASWYYAHVDVSESSFQGNQALYGGAIRHVPYEGKVWDLVVADSSFVDNAALTGGALLTEWTNAVSLSGNHFEGNQASESTGGALDVYVAASVEAHHNRFCENSAATGGGALFLEWIDTDAYWNNDWIDNSAQVGGALYRYNAKAGSVTHDSFVGNTASEEGGAAYASYGYLEFVSNVVAHTGAGAGLYSADPSTLVNSSITHSGWADNTEVHAGGYWWITDGEDGNVVAQDPGFVSYEGCESDLRLGWDSPFRDIGADQDRDGSAGDAGSSGGPEATSEELEDTALPEDSDVPVDSQPPEDSQPQQDSEPSDEAPVQEPESCSGCAAGGRTGAVGTVLLGLGLLLRRRQGAKS